MSPRSILPLAAPLVVAWARRHEARILRLGEPLAADELALARAVGVGEPQRIRVLEVDRVPLPWPGLLARLARWARLPGPDVGAMTLGHGIYLRRGLRAPRLVAHECRHVQQVERAGSLRAFLARYLAQVAEHGYRDAPFEADARRAETVLARATGASIAGAGRMSASPPHAADRWTDRSS